MTKPTLNTQRLMTAAYEGAKNKAFVDRVKSKAGMAVRLNAKDVAKAGVSFGIGFVPIVGGYLQTAFDVGQNKVTSMYKQRKAKVEAERWGLAGSEAGAKKIAKSALKMMAWDNHLKMIDEARKKVEMSIKECNENYTTMEQQSCGEYAEFFYHWFRLDVRSDKLIMKIDLVMDALAQQRKIAESYKDQVDKRIDALIKGANSFTAGSAPHAFCGDTCVNKPDTGIADTDHLIAKSGVKEKVKKLFIPRHTRLSEDDISEDDDIL